MSDVLTSKEAELDYEVYDGMDQRENPIEVTKIEMDIGYQNKAVKPDFIDVQIDEAREQMNMGVTSSTPPANPVFTSTKKMEVKVIKCKLLDSQIAEAREQMKIEKETKRKKMEDGEKSAPSTKKPKHNGSVEIKLSDFLPKKFFPKLGEDSDSSEEGKDRNYEDDEKVLDNAMKGILTAMGNGDDSDSSDEDSEDEENVIKFKVLIDGHIIPLVSLSDVESDISVMINADEIVVPEDKQSINVVFDYPLKKKFVFELESPRGKGFTRGELVTAIAGKYQEIYMEEEETSELPVETMAERYGGSLLNRAETEGKYGIWGHELGDLVLGEVTFKPEENRYYLSISS